MSLAVPGRLTRISNRVIALDDLTLSDSPGPVSLPTDQYPTRGRRRDGRDEPRRLAESIRACPSAELVIALYYY